MPRVNCVTCRRWRQAIAFRIGTTSDRILDRGARARGRRLALLHDHPIPDSAGIATAIKRGGHFLHHQQRSDGSLRGFCLYPGASVAWVTAHVAFVLEGVPELHQVCRGAALYLHGIGPSDGGWGFNRRVAKDTDSTAQALMVLQTANLAVPEFLLKAVLDNESPSGGFPTYAPSGMGGTAAHGWQVAHPEVSAIVVECLRRHGGHEDAIARTCRWLESTTREGVIPNYWWNGEYYSLWIQARTGLLPVSARTRVERALGAAGEIPQLPMLLVAALAANMRSGGVVAAIRRLLALQLSDGSWPCARCLRVTDPACRDPVGTHHGPDYADHRRVLSTAHALAALSAVLSGQLQLEKEFPPLDCSRAGTPPILTDADPPVGSASNHDLTTKGT